jgi:hypothetical protein
MEISYVAAAGAGVLGLQLLVLLQVTRSRRAAGKSARRVEQLTAALELLTDTTETGFVNIAAELERVGARPTAPASTRRATASRIGGAARRGQSVAEIAATEGLSESEVRLHLGLAEAVAQATAAEAAREPAEDDARSGVLGDIEHWMSTLGRRRTPRRRPADAALRV